MSKKATDILSYITPIGLIIAFIFGDRENSKLHLNQGLVLWLCGIILNILDRILSRLPLIGGIIGVIILILDIVLFVFWIMGLVSAIRGDDKKLPVIGDIVLYR